MSSIQVSGWVKCDAQEFFLLIIVKILLFNRYFDNQNLETAGWGTIEFAGPQPDILQKTSVKVLPYKKCDDSLTNQAKLCAFTQYTDTCQRDSGGSLYFTQMSRRYSVAIVSYGEACGIKPSVNTRVTSYLLWIRINTGYAYLCNK